MKSRISYGKRDGILVTGGGVERTMSTEMEESIDRETLERSVRLVVEFGEFQ